MTGLLGLANGVQFGGYILLGMFGSIGLTALLCPQTFGRIATCGGRWIDSKPILEALDKRYDIDRFVLPHSRLLGVALMIAVGVLAFVLSRI